MTQTIRFLALATLAMALLIFGGFLGFLCSIFYPVDPRFLAGSGIGFTCMYLAARLMQHVEAN